MHHFPSKKTPFLESKIGSRCYFYGMRTSLLALVTTASLALCATALGCGSSETRTEFEDSGTGTGTGNGNGNGNGTGSNPFNFGDAGNQADAAESNECRQMDIVFVVDNSGSMSEEQTNLKSNFPKFVDVLNAYKTKSGAQLDYRLAVTSTDVVTGLKGAFASGGGVSRAWLERTDANLTTVFTQRASLGTTGSSIECGLEALKLGINSPVNTGFFRKDALFGIVILTDEDEGGLENQPKGTSETYLTAFDALKEQRARWAGAVIAGEKQCSSAGFGSAGEAVRLKDFIGKAGKNGVFSSICEGDLPKGLSQALATFDAACRNFPPATK